MKTSLLHKEGIDLLVEEMTITNQLEDEYNDSSDICTKLPDEDKKCKIIDLRNEGTISKLENSAKAVSGIMSNLGRYAFGKTADLSDIIEEVFRINLVLGTKYKMNDIFINAKLEKTKDYEKIITVTFDSTNIDIIQKYRDTISKYISYCHDCLFEDLYDKETLMKYLPIVYFLLSRIYC